MVTAPARRTPAPTRSSGLAFVAVSDDLTGALVAAAELEAAGLRATVRTHQGNEQRPAAGAAVIDTASRLLSADDAAARVRGTLGCVRGWSPHGLPRLYKRIDSALRGNWAAELAAAVELAGPALVVPAAPVLGVATIGGEQRLGGIPIDRTHYGAGPDAATGSSVLAGLPGSIGVTLDDVRGDALAEVLDAALGHGANVVCDAVVDDDLLRIARAAFALDRLPLLAGTVGFLGAAARAAAPVRPAVLVVAGSVQGATRAQLDRFAAAGEVVRLSEEAAAESAERRVEAHLRAGRHVAVASAPEGDEPATAPPAMSAALARIAASVLAEHHPAGVVIVGGETGDAVVSACGVHDVRVLAVPWPGITEVRFSGGLLDGVRGHVKSGALGSEDWLVEAVASLSGEAVA